MAQGTDAVNEVVLVGRVSQVEDVKVLPSGDRVRMFRVVVDRPRRRGRRSDPPQRRQVDAVECAAWAARPRAVVERLAVGDIVEVRGSLRRRFYRAGGSPTSRFEVEAVSVRVRARVLSA